jgi:hypothetical protein
MDGQVNPGSTGGPLDPNDVDGGADAVSPSGAGGGGGRLGDQFFEQVGVWPVRLTFLSRTGLTLWGPAGNEDGRDLVLTRDGRLVLTGSEAALRAFVAQDEASSMAGVPGYQLLRQRLQDGTVRLDEPTAFDFRAVAHALDWPADRWDRDSFAALVDALNMLGDLAEALDDDELLARLDSREYVAQLERLTFLTDDEVAEAAVALDRPLLRQVVGMGIDHIERRVSSM